MKTITNNFTFIFSNFTFEPRVLIHSIELITSSDFNKLYAIDFFFDNEDIKTHLIDKLLSPSTKILLLNDLIFFFIFRIFFHLRY